MTELGISPISFLIEGQAAEGRRESGVPIRGDIGGGKDGYGDVRWDANRVESLTFFGAEDFVGKIDHPAVWEATRECVREEALSVLSDADHGWSTSHQCLGECFTGTLCKRTDEFDYGSTKARATAGMHHNGLFCRKARAVRWTVARLFGVGEVISTREAGGDGKTNRIAAAEVYAFVEDEGAEVGIGKDLIQSGFENAEIALAVPVFRIPAHCEYAQVANILADMTIDDLTIGELLGLRRKKTVSDAPDDGHLVFGEVLFGFAFGELVAAGTEPLEFAMDGMGVNTSVGVAKRLDQIFHDLEKLCGRCCRRNGDEGVLCKRIPIYVLEVEGNVVFRKIAREDFKVGGRGIGHELVADGGKCGDAVEANFASGTDGVEKFVVRRISIANGEEIALRILGRPTGSDEMRGWAFDAGCRRELKRFDVGALNFEDVSIAFALPDAIEAAIRREGR